MSKLNKYLLAGLVGLGVCLTAFAVSPGSGKYCDRYGEGYGHGTGRISEGFEQRMERRQAYHAQREEALHDKLNLSADQETAWKAFVESKPNVGPKRSFKRGAIVNMSAPERMETILEHMQDRQTRMVERLEEIKKFYSVLTPEQQKIFDDEFMPRHRGQFGSGRSS